MNIFWLDGHPKLAATYHCDKHVVKMILETAQLLSGAHHYWHDQRNTKAPTELYAWTHKDHPCSHWVRLNDKNYYWTWCLFYWLSNEYLKRYEKKHTTTSKLLAKLINAPSGISIADKHTIPQLAMPTIYYDKNPVIAYRRYYIGEKYTFAKWAHSKEPHWWPGSNQVYQLYAIGYPYE